MHNSKKTIPIKELYELNSINSKDLESIDLKQKKEIKKILIIKWGGMGDIILATSVMEDIYMSFPKSKIHLNTLPEWKCLFNYDL